ncbi:MAG: anthranilate phosphoribosyltransferase [Desulfuromonadales bacterium]
MQPMPTAEFGSYIQRLIERRDLGRQECYRLFSELMRNSQSDLQQGAFLAALAAKGETVDEMAGAWQAIDEFDTVHVVDLPETIVDNSGTGMDGFKTFNVSSAAALVVAAHGIPVARHGARAITSRCGTVDIMESVGINIECEAELVAESVRQAGIGLFNGMSPLIHPGGLGRILSQIRFGTILNIAASLAHPARPSRALRGVYSAALVEPVARLMSTIGYRKALVVHGTLDGEQHGVDELSVCGASTIACLEDGSISRLEVTPEEAGISRHSAAAVAAAASRQEETARFISVAAGSGVYRACEDFTALNAGALLWMCGSSCTLADGVADARHTLTSGGALDKLREWCGVQADPRGKGMQQLIRLEKEVLQ